MDINKRFQSAKEDYEELGIDVEKALEKLSKVKISIQCWQGDDITGFEVEERSLSGGIGVTGNYPGKARNPEELRKDLEKALSLIPGKHKVNLHAIYAETNGIAVDRDEIEPKHFQNWVDWAKNGAGIGL